MKISGFGATVCLQRKTLRVSPEEVANALLVTSTTLRNIERLGVRTMLCDDQLRRLSKVISIDFDVLRELCDKEFLKNQKALAAHIFKINLESANSHENSRISRPEDGAGRAPPWSPGGTLDAEEIQECEF